MEPTPTIARHEAINRDEPLVHDWRVMQLTRLGIPGLLAEGAAGLSTGTTSPGWFSAAARRCSPSASCAEVAPP